MIERVPFYTPSDRQAAFLVMHAVHAPWTTDEYPELKDVEIPVTLMIHRADGGIGWPGGHGDELESPQQTVAREAGEEIFMPVPRGITPLAAYREDNGLIVRTFEYFTTYNELLAAQRLAPRAAHYGAEITGVILPHLVDYRDYGYHKPAGIINLLKSPSATAVPYELALLAQKVGAITRVQVDEYSDQLGYQLDYWEEPVTTH